MTRIKTDIRFHNQPQYDWHGRLVAFERHGASVSVDVELTEDITSEFLEDLRVLLEKWRIRTEGIEL